MVNADEVQSVVRPITKDVKRTLLKKNPLKNLNELLKLNPYAKTTRKMALLAKTERVKSKKEKLERKRTSTKALKFNLAESGLFCVLPWLTMGILVNIREWIADTLVTRGLSITTVHKIMQSVGFPGDRVLLSFSHS